MQTLIIPDATAGGREGCLSPATTAISSGVGLIPWGGRVEVEAVQRCRWGFVRTARVSTIDISSMVSTRCATVCQSSS